MVLLHVCITVGEAQPSGRMDSAGGVQSTPDPLSREETRVYTVKGDREFGKSHVQ